MNHPFKASNRPETVALSVLSVLFGIIATAFVARHFEFAPYWFATLPRTWFVGALPVSLIALLAGVFFFTPFSNVHEWISKILFVLLPGILGCAFGWIIEDGVPDTARIAVTFYVLAIATYCAYRLVKRNYGLLHQPEVKEAGLVVWFRRQGLLRIVAVIVLTGTFAGFALRDLGRAAVVDEALWLYGRIPKYWNAIAGLEPRKTNISDKPGITVALASGVGMLKEPNPLVWKSLRGDDQGIDRFFLWFRLPIVIVAALFLPLFYFLLERIAGKSRAMTAYALIALSPVTIGMTKIINPDSFLWLFAPLSLFAYFAYFKRKHVGYLLISGFFLGLALLTKYVANILFVFMLASVFFEYVFHRHDEDFLVHLRRSLLGYALWTFTALSTFFLLFPATWVKPTKILDATLFSQAFEKVSYLFLLLFAIIILDNLLNKSRFSRSVMTFFREKFRVISWIIGIFWMAYFATVAINTWLGMRFIDYPAILAAPKTVITFANFPGLYTTNAYPLLFGITPVVFLFLFLSPLLFLRRAEINSATGKTSLYGILFILLYYLGTTINNVGAITRYQVMLFPIAAAIAGLSLGSAVRIVKNRIDAGFRFRPLLEPIIITLIFVSGAWTLSRTPFPLSYSSPLLSDKYAVDVKDMGPGSYEAATYLNSLPNAKNLLVWTDKSGVCKFFNGRCKSGYDWENYRDLSFDYIVVSSGRESRTGKRVGTAISDDRSDTIRLDRYYDRSDPLWQILINGRPTHFVKIFSSR